MRSFLRRTRRLARAFVGRDVNPSLDIRVETLHLGSPLAGWIVAPQFITLNAIVYAAGVGEDISFDLAMIEKFGAEVHAFDPTPRSIEWARKQKLPAPFHLHEWGFAGFDGSIEFHPPPNPAHVSFSVLDRSPEQPAVSLPVKRVQTTMELLGHDRIDVLKMDIEGSEYDVLEDLQDSGIRPKQLLVEFHHRFPQIGLDKTKKAAVLLREMGYQLFAISAIGEEWSFLRSD